MTIKLVEFTEKNIDLTFEWIKDREFRRLFLMRGTACKETHEAYFARVLKDPSQKIYALYTGEAHIGNCGFKNILPSAGEGELWIYIGDRNMRGRGYGLRATELLIREGQHVLGFDKIYLHVADFNTAARNLYKKLGFYEVPVQEDREEWKNRGCTIIKMELKKHENSNDAA